MSSNLTQILNKAKYKHVTQTKQDILQATKYSKTLVPKIEMYTYPVGVTKELVCLDGTISVIFRKSNYNIPIAIYINNEHPIYAPICYVRPTREMTIKQSEHVDGSGRIFLPYLSEWDKNTSDLIGLIQIMQLTFGNTPPVFQKFRDTNTSVVAQQHPVAHPSASPPALPLSKTENGEKLEAIQNEIQVLKKYSENLNQGKAQLEEMTKRMAKEIIELTEAKQKFLNLDRQLQQFIIKYDEEKEEINPDEVYGPSQPLFKQLLESFAEENAVVDAIYYTGEGLRKGVITLDVFLKNVRELSQRQFMLRALMQACRSKASLPN